MQVTHQIQPLPVCCTCGNAQNTSSPELLCAIPATPPGCTATLTALHRVCVGQRACDAQMVPISGATHETPLLWKSLGGSS